MRALLLTLTVCLVVLPANAKYSGGTGEPNDPYQIATAADLIALGETPGDYDKHFILTADIDLDPNLPGRKVFDKAVISTWTGVFDGKGHRILHMAIVGGGYLGLFGEVRTGAQVRDLGIADVNVTGTDDYGGALAGINAGALTGCYSTGAVSGREDTGGLVGDNWGIVADCYSACVVKGGYGVGGLMGENSRGTVSHCYSVGRVQGLGRNSGLTAYNRGLVIGCFWDTQTSGQTASAAGTDRMTVQMQTASTFLDAGWDFVGETVNGRDDIWKIAEGIGYPRLSWEKYSGGTGEPNDPYQIATAADLIALGETPEDYDKHFILTADIDLDPNLPGRKVFDKAVIAPSWETPFGGVFDGNGHTISHLTVTGKGSLGLFGCLGRWNAPTCEVKNLGAVDVNVTSSADYVGGLVGYNQGTVTKCYSTGSVSGVHNVGGLVGFSELDSSVAQCYSSSAVIGEGNVGGLVGWNCGSVSQSYSTGAVTGMYSVGGLAGHNGAGALLIEFMEGRVTHCYSTRTVSGKCRVGGLVGYAEVSTMTQCYSTGPVSGTEDVGGLVGLLFSQAVSGCFWDVQTSGQATSVGGTGLTTAEMQTAQTFLDAGWDFVGETANGTEDIWWIDDGKDYPRLWWDEQPTRLQSSW
jgi:hypothetical protein